MGNCIVRKLILSLKMEGNKSHSSVIRVKQEAIPEEESGDVVTGTVLQDKVAYGHIPI